RAAPARLGGSWARWTRSRPPSRVWASPTGSIEPPRRSTAAWRATRTRPPLDRRGGPCPAEGPIAPGPLRGGDVRHETGRHPARSRWRAWPLVLVLALQLVPGFISHLAPGFISHLAPGFISHLAPGFISHLAPGLAPRVARVSRAGAEQPSD